MMAPDLSKAVSEAKMEAASEISGGSLRNYTEVPSGLSNEIQIR